MQFLSVIVGVFGASIWDVTQNNADMLRLCGHICMFGLQKIGYM